VQSFSDELKSANVLIAAVWLFFYAMAVLRVVMEPAAHPAATAIPDDTSATEVTAAWK
jgi:hypothetical protein